MTRRNLPIVTTVLIFAVTPLLAQQPSDAQRLQAAIQLEVIGGDLRAAVEEYRALADSQISGVAVSATLRLASAYDRLGHPESRAIYERILREFPNETDAVDLARRWLAAHPAGVTRAERILTAGGAIGTPSFDGRYVAFAESSDGWGNLAVRDLQTGDTRRLTTDASGSGWVGDVLISPDGTRIAYRWEGRSESTRIIDRDGRNMRVLTRTPYGEELHAWSLDGRSIAGVHRNYAGDRTSQIALIDTADGSVTRLKSLGWREVTIGGFSPDGRYLAYAVQNESAPGASIFVLATDGSSESLLTDEARGGMASPAWSPDGTRVVFRPRDPGAPDLWSLRVVNGRASGNPELLRAGVGETGAWSLGFTADGSYYYAVQDRRREAYLADFDQEALMITATSAVSDRAPGANPSISPDGGRVAFLRARRAGNGDAASDSTARPSTTVLVVRSLEDGDERTYGVIPQPNPLAPLLWAPDGGSVFLLSQDLGVLVRLDLATGGYESAFRPSGDIWNTLALSPDGGTLFYTAIEVIDGRAGPMDPKRLRLMKRVLATGQEEAIFETESRGLGLFGLTLSADGVWLAFAINVGDDERAVLVMPASGGPAAEIFHSAIDAVSHLGAMIWTRDNRHIILSGSCGPGGSQQLCALPRTGGQLRLIGMNVQSISSRMISRDGRRIAFTGGTSDPPQLWVIRGLLPPAPNGRRR
jgi:Tol biopolymer transport system component